MSRSKIILADELPAGWKVAPLGKVTLESRRTLDPQNHPEEVFNYYSIPAYQDGQRPLPETGANIRSLKLVVEPGTVLFGKLNPRVSKVWLVAHGGHRRRIASTEFIPLVPSDRVDSEFLYYLAWSDFVLPKSRELVSGSTPSRQRVDVSAFLRLEVPLPPLSEQRAIAHVLRAVQRAKEGTEQVIAAARELKKSLMRHLFTFGSLAISEIATTQLAHTDAGEIRHDWDVRELGGLAKVTGGKRLPKGHEFADGVTPYPYIRVTDFDSGSVSLKELRYLTTEDRAALRRYTVTTGDLSVSIAGTTGIVVRVPNELDGANLTENAARVIVVDDGVDAEYLRHALGSPSGVRQMQTKTTKSTQPKLALARLRTVAVPLPSRAEQRKIATTLQTVERKIAAEEARRDALATLFDSLLHDLMSARLRVTDLKMPA